MNSHSEFPGWIVLARQVLFILAVTGLNGIMFLAVPILARAGWTTTALSGPNRRARPRLAGPHSPAGNLKRSV